LCRTQNERNERIHPSLCNQHHLCTSVLCCLPCTIHSLVELALAAVVLEMDLAMAAVEQGMDLGTIRHTSMACRQLWRASNDHHCQHTQTTGIGRTANPR